MRKVAVTFLLPEDEQALAESIVDAVPSARFVDLQRWKQGDRMEGRNPRDVTDAVAQIWDRNLFADVPIGIQWMLAPAIKDGVLKDGRLAVDYDPMERPGLDNFVKEVWRRLNRCTAAIALEWPNGVVERKFRIGPSAKAVVLSGELALAQGALHLRPVGES
jgi:hypothetical protein